MSMGSKIDPTSWCSGSPFLDRNPDLDCARQVLRAYRPDEPSQERLRQEILGFIDEHPRTAHLRSCLEGHLTASALVAEEGTGRVLLMHHRKLNKWLQPGGHCDGDANLPGVALREAVEESGIETLRILPEVIDVDIHPIPERLGEPAHRHLDTRFIVLARRGATPRQNVESNDLRWLTVEEALALGVDDSVARLFRCVSGAF